MRMKLVGNQMGPRQFEFPPNMSVVASPGVYSTWWVSPAYWKMKGFSSWALDRERMPKFERNSLGSSM